MNWRSTLCSTKAMEPLLQVSNLCIELGGKRLLTDVNFELHPNETLVILGPNGAGKTVLLKALLGIIPHRGEILWKEGIRIGYVPQRIPLQKDLPVSVRDFFGLKGISSQEAAKALKNVGIDRPDFLDYPLGIVSSGQFQRVLIAWALTQDPDILLFDEPTAGIDASGEETIQELLHKTQERRHLAMILVTHDPSTVYRLATHVLCLNGRATCYGTPEEVLDHDPLP